MHDVFGTPLKVGDLVFIPCRVTHLCESTPDYCNVTVETLHGRRPDGEKSVFSAINTAQLERVEDQE